MVYVKPQDVHAPQDCWTLQEILIDQGESTNQQLPDKWSLAAGCWQGKPCLGIRLNGGGEKPSGYPVAYGVPTWLVLPTEFNQLVLPLLPRDQQERTKQILPAGNNLICWPPALVTSDEYVAPENVNPRTGRCKLARVLIDQGKSPTDNGNPAKFSIAVGSWGPRYRLLLRWNGVAATKHAKGMPLAGSQPSWFPLPVEVDDLIDWLDSNQEVTTAERSRFTSSTFSRLRGELEQHH